MDAAFAIGYVEKGAEHLAQVPEGVRYMDMTPAQRQSAYYGNMLIAEGMATGRQSGYTMRTTAKHESTALFVLRCAWKCRDEWAKKVRA